MFAEQCYNRVDAGPCRAQRLLHVYLGGVRFHVKQEPPVIVGYTGTILEPMVSFSCQSCGLTLSLMDSGRDSMNAMIQGVLNFWTEIHVCTS